MSDKGRWHHYWKTTCCSSSNCGNVTSITHLWFLCSTWSPYMVYKPLVSPVSLTLIKFSNLVSLAHLAHKSLLALQCPYCFPYPSLGGMFGRLCGKTELLWTLLGLAGQQNLTARSSLQNHGFLQEPCLYKNDKINFTVIPVLLST